MGDTAVGAEFRPVIELAPDEGELGQRAFEDAHTLLFVAGFGGREGLEFFLGDVGVEGGGAFGPGGCAGDGFARGGMAAAGPGRPGSRHFGRRLFDAHLTPIFAVGVDEPAGFFGRRAAF